MPHVLHAVCRDVGRLSELQASTAPDPRQARLAELRHAIARIERKARSGKGLLLSLTLPEIHRHLPEPGLAAGVLHEIVSASYADRPSAFGFGFALLVEAQRLRKGPAVFVATQRALKDFDRPFSQGLRHLGVEPRRLVLVEARNDKDALWAMEEALRSDARPSIVMGANSADLNLTVSRRLNLAAEAQAVPLVMLRMAGAQGTNAAATRWSVKAAPAARNAFGALTHARWHLTLERCRNGCPGQWLVEWNHVTHRFCLAEGVADRTPHAGAGLRRAG